MAQEVCGRWGQRKGGASGGPVGQNRFAERVGCDSGAETEPVGRVK